MKKVFTLQIVQCQTCNTLSQVNPNICKTLEDVMRLAHKAHKESKIVCGKPELICVYAPALVSNSLIDPKPSVVGAGQNSNTL